MTTSSDSSKRWPEGAVVYQIYPRSFYDSNADGVGDIPGITSKLNYLHDLGVNALWLSPFYPSPMADFGYDVADYCGVDPLFGNLDDMRQLLEAAHAKDIKIMVDLVPNHSSDDHEWFQQSRQSRDNAYADWYIWRDAKGTAADGSPIPPNNWIDEFAGKQAWEWVEARQQFYLHSFHVRQPDLNWQNPAVREAIKSVMRFWLDMGVDGFRVDAVNFMAKDPDWRDDPPNPHYNPATNRLFESLTHTNSQAWPELYGYLAEMAAVLREDAYHESPRFMVTEAYIRDIDRTAGYLRFYQAMGPDVAAPFNFEGLSLPWEAGPWRQFLGGFHPALAQFSSQAVTSYAFGNHDRPRLASRLGDAAARSAAVMLLTLPGMSFIYNGDELGMQNGVVPLEYVQDPGARGGMGRDPERTPLQWSAAKNAGFSEANRTWLPVADGYQMLNVEVERQDPGSYLNLYRQLTALRNQSAALKHGDLQVLDCDNDAVLGYSRTHNSQTITVLINFSDKPATLVANDTYGNCVVSSIADRLPKVASLDGSDLRPYEALVFKATAADHHQ